MIGEAPNPLKAVWTKVPYLLDELGLEIRRLMERFPQLNTGAPGPGFCSLDFTTTDETLLNLSDPRTGLKARYPTTVRYGPAPSPFWSLTEALISADARFHCPRPMRTLPRVCGTHVGS